MKCLTFFVLTWVVTVWLAPSVTPQSSGWLKLAFVLTFVVALAALMSLLARVAGQKEML